MARRTVPVTSPPPADTLVPADLPSTKELGDADRKLAEIDQDGYAFAVHPSDTPVFNRRSRKIPRLRYDISIILRRGEVLVEKHFRRGPRPDLSLGIYLFTQLDIPFFNEAAALIRLRRVEGVPRLRNVDIARSTLCVDYIHGETLQQSTANRGAKILDLDCPKSLDEAARDAFEVAAFLPMREAHGADIARLFASILSAGVAPLDVKLGNVLVGARTGAHYWLDFESAHLASLHDHAEAAALSRERMERWFGVTADLPPSAK